MRQQLAAGCRSAGIGCLDCKRPLIDAVLEAQVMLQERARPYEEDPGQVRAIMDEGCARAEAVAAETLQEVRQAVGTVYS